MENPIKCTICDLQCEGLHIYLQHVKIHRKNNVFQCPFNTCSVKFRSFAAFRKHLKQQHSAAGITGLLFKCLVVGCDFAANDFSKIMKHAMDHISAGQPVYCPVGCPTKKPFATANSLRIHRMYVHRNRSLKMSPSTQKHSSADARKYEDLPVEFEEAFDFESDKEAVEKENLGVVAERVLGSLFLKLFSKHHVMDTAIQEIMEALKKKSEISKKKF